MPITELLLPPLQPLLLLLLLLASVTLLPSSVTSRTCMGRRNRAETIVGWALTDVYVPACFYAAH